MLCKTGAMESVLLDTPDGISARLAWDPKVALPDRRKALARELVSTALEVDPADVRIEEAPEARGYQTRLIASTAEGGEPLTVKTASYRAATVVAIADKAVPLGLDLRDTHPDEAAIHEMQRGSHMLEGVVQSPDLQGRIEHWTRVQAVLEADGRLVRAQPDHVRLDSARRRGWVSDRKVTYHLTDLSRDGWIISLAYGAEPA